MTPDETTHARQCQRIRGWGFLCLLCCSALLLTIPGRVIWLQQAPSEPLQASIQRSSSRSTPLVRRGDVLDRRGRVLATSAVGRRAFIDPSLSQDPMTLGVQLNQAIGLSGAEVQRLLAGRLHRRYVALPQLLEPWQVQRLEGKPIAGVFLEEVPVRRYPQDLDAASLVGMVGQEHKGLAGIEYVLERELQSQAGRLETYRDAARRPMWVPPSGFEPGQDGRDVRLSIDLVVQRFAETRLAQAVDELGAAGGRLIAIDPETGGLLTIAEHEVQGPKAPRQQRLHRVRSVSDPYEPGSTFKPFVWAAATSAGLATSDEVLPTPTAVGHRTSFGRVIRDAHYYGPSTWRKVLVKSLNSGMAIVAERMSHESMQKLVTQLGFGQVSGCGLPGETAGLVTSPSKWSNYTQTSVAMGHEIAVTPIQMARAFCAFARDGSMPSVTIRDRSRDAGVVTTQIFDPAIATLTRQTMHAVMHEGTGRRARSAQYSMFGKSGTAQMPKAEGGGYHQDRYISSFIAGAPLDNPRLVVLCVIEDPDKSRGSHYGGSTAGPVVRDMVDFTLPYLGIAPDVEDPSGDRATVARAGHGQDAGSPNPAPGR